jgi:hypothetical protein
VEGFLLVFYDPFGPFDAYLKGCEKSSISNFDETIADRAFEALQVRNLIFNKCFSEGQKNEDIRENTWPGLSGACSICLTESCEVIRETDLNCADVHGSSGSPRFSVIVFDNRNRFRQSNQHDNIAKERWIMHALFSNINNVLDAIDQPKN